MKTLRWKFSLVVLLAVIFEVLSDKEFQKTTPNGEHVPNPCKNRAGTNWQGVGHQNPVGGGERNPFGQDKARLGNWASLCPLDSDGDGKTNGQELGDPNCQWREGQEIHTHTGLSHPGVCEPVDSPACADKNAWLDCTIDDFSCDAVKEPDVKNFTMRFPNQQLPAQETTLHCYAFRLPADKEYHMIASVPVVDNVNVVHHMMLYGCLDPFPVESQRGPFDCNMIRECPTFMMLWSIGTPGECLDQNVGLPFGENGINTVVLQIHYHNHMTIETYTDSSGMTLSYTDKMRLYEGHRLALGQYSINIPGEKAIIYQTSTCSNACTNALLPSQIYITSATNHMHGLGKMAVTGHYRNGVKLRDIGYEPGFVYNSPADINYDPPIEVRPGDELRTTCEYNSVGRKAVTYYGDSVNDEMCFTNLAFYSKTIAISSDCFVNNGRPWISAG